MTQDQYGQPASPGQVVRGEVVADDEADVSPNREAAPMTHFQKVASALRGDHAGQATTPTSPDSPDAAAPWTTRPDWGAAASSPEPGDTEAAEGTDADQVGAVRSPDAGHGDYWDDDEDALEAEPGEDPDAGSAEGAAASATPVSGDQEAGPPAPDGQAQEAADQADQDAHEATDRSVTQPNVFGAPQPGAATVETVPIALATEEPTGNGGRHAASEAELRPGESGTTLGPGQSGYASLLPDTEDLRAQWRRIQYKFVDDPRVSVTEAADVIAQVATRLEAAIAERQRGLRGRWDTAAATDTETLRETLRMYRSFLDQLIGPEPS